MTWNKGRILMCLSLRIKILCSRCETGVTSYKSKDIYRSGFRQVLSADCFYMVKAGDTVKTKQSIGQVFSDGTDNGRTVLHFQLRREKEKLNPEPWLNR